MRFKGLDLNLLVAFDALMAERNVTRAAARVGVSQPAMSAALARLPAAAPAGALRASAVVGAMVMVAFERTVFEPDASSADAVEAVLAALAPLHRLKIDSGCRGGGCGVCKIAIVEGEAELGPMSAAHVTPEERTTRRAALACRVYPRSDLVVTVLERRVFRLGG